MRTYSIKRYISLFVVILFFLLPIKTSAMTRSVNSSCYSMTVSCEGATDIVITSDKLAKISVFKKGIFSYQLLKSLNSSRKMNYTSGLSGRNNYYIIVTSRTKKTAHISISVNQHQDKKISAIGGVWKVKSNSPTANRSILYMKKFYWNRDHCRQALSYVGKSKYLNYQSKLVNGTISLGGIVMGATGIKALQVASTFLTIAQIGFSVNFKSSMINQVKSCGGYNSRTDSFSRGVVITEYMCAGFTHLSVERWYPGQMTGPKGYIGTWSTK